MNQNIITLGLGAPRNNLLVGGFYAGGLPCEIPVVDNDILLQGYLSLDNSPISQGFSALFADIFPDKVLEFDSILHPIIEFDSPLQNKDLIIRKYKMWI